MLNTKCKERLRLLVVVRWPVGGIRTFIRYVYRNFAYNRYEFTILAPEVPELRVLLDDLRGFKVNYIPASVRHGGWGFFLSVVSTILKGKYDLIHSHGLTSGICAALPAIFKRIPHLLTVHDVFTVQQFLGFRGAIKKIIISIVLPLIDAVQPVSHDAHDNLVEFVPSLNYFRQKLHTIPNGIEIDRFMGEDRRDFKGELCLDDDVFLIGFFGRFMSQKGFRYLLDALHLLKSEYVLPKRPLILTFGEGGYIREDAGRVKSLGLEKDVYFLPFTQNIASALRGLDVVAMPSLWEACGLLAMEAMVAGVPLIGSSCIGLREVIKDTPCIAVPTQDGRALAEALFMEMGNSSRERFKVYRAEAANRFDVTRQSRELESLLLSLVNPS